MTYLGLLLLMRLCGKRAFGEMSPFDVLVLILVGGALRSAITGNDTSITAPFIGVAAFLLVDKIIAWLCTRWAAGWKVDPPSWSEQDSVTTMHCVENRCQTPCSNAPCTITA